MIPRSTVSKSAQNYISKKLCDLEKKENIRIVFAIESGSRAWGFPSINSDYDVRFVYIRTKNDYLSIVDRRDVIETDIIHDAELGAPFDLNGWDIRKTLTLALKSNAVLIEWLQSPIIYLNNEKIILKIKAFTTTIADLTNLEAHYYSLMMHTWEQIIQSDTHVNVKLYCYALRPALALQWLNQFKKPSPMDIFSLYQGLAPYLDIEQEISNIIALKTKITEQTVIPRDQKIDAFIMSFQHKAYEKLKISIDQQNVNKANSLFQSLLI